VGEVTQITDEQGRGLCELVRATIARRFDHAMPVPACPDETLMEPRGAFVTLTVDGRLRGCIGRIEAHGPLWQIISEMAAAAAFQDSRFPPLSQTEMDKLDIEISVLGPLELIENPEDVVIGTHGLFIRKGNSSGLLLPQVASSRNWDVKTFLAETCRKAGLQSYDWKEDADVFIFSADIFDEHRGEPDA
jgi:AmmeMemoRadiSam system protein A